MLEGEGEGERDKLTETAGTLEVRGRGPWSGGTEERHRARLRQAARQRGTGRGGGRNGKQGDEHFRRTFTLRNFFPLTLWGQ